ncbi:MAG: DUF4143 domain-containing protein [Candidatus Bathyarchaeota archaeon]|nr:DUF4143 domain-containing protein [Candidatus Bathyarchaeota archaeon]
MQRRLKSQQKNNLNFLEYTKAVFFTATLEQYHKSPKKRFARQQKTYIIDTGFSKLFGEIDKGRALENAVFIELLRRRKIAEAIYYVRLKSGKEVDFIVNQKTHNCCKSATMYLQQRHENAKFPPLQKPPKP